MKTVFTKRIFAKFRNKVVEVSFLFSLNKFYREHFCSLFFIFYYTNI